MRGMSHLYDYYSAALYGVILRILANEDLAQDTLQEVFVKIWFKSDQYDETKGRLFTWMLNIARNAALDVKRSAKFKRSDQVQPLDNAIHTLKSGELKTDHIGLEQVMENLSAEQRQAIDYIYFQGFTHMELAKELDLPLGTVKSRVRTALKKLRSAFI